MTGAEQIALIHQINRHAHLSSHQMEAVMGALHHLKWGPKMNKNSDLMSTAPLPNYNAATPARCEPPEGTKEGTYHVHVNSGAKRVCLWRNQRWYIPGQNSQTAGEAGRDGWRYSHEMSLDPPHPHAALRDALRDAVVEAAMKAYYKGWLPRHIDEVSKSCAALAVAQTPPDPVGQLKAVWDAIADYYSAALSPGDTAKMKAAIAALNRGSAA